MKKVVGIINCVAFVMVLLVTLFADPDPPPGHTFADVNEPSIVNTYSDPDPPPGHYPI